MHLSNQAHQQQTTGTWDHRRLRDGEWWRKIPGWRQVGAEQFLDHHWQLKNSPTKPEVLFDLLGPRVDESFRQEVRAGFERAPMAMRITPYIVGLIDWSDPRRDPLRRQFLPLGREIEPDHPMCALDALEEQRDAVAPGLTHRYPDKVLFLALDVCPVYCRYCTRSYSIGADTDSVGKLDFHPSAARWDQAFAYLRANDQVEDVVVSGGDIYLLSARHLQRIGDALLEIPNIRRIRIATKGLAVMPQKMLTDQRWLDVLADLAERARRGGVHLCVHTHFAHPDEITEISRQACDLLFQRGITVRNQCVLLRGVNDDPETMRCLVRRLGWINVQPYYVYIHDMVPGVESLRTTLAEAIEIEKQLRGQTAGFMTPTFVCDTVGGGGKRDLHSFEFYDEDKGVGVYRSPAVDPERPFFYFDPLRALSPEMQRAWSVEGMRKRIIDGVVRRAGL